jgi:hypothetical protein
VTVASLPGTRLGSLFPIGRNLCRRQGRHTCGRHAAPSAYERLRAYRTVGLPRASGLCVCHRGRSRQGLDLARFLTLCGVILAGGAALLLGSAGVASRP